MSPLERHLEFAERRALKARRNVDLQAVTEAQCSKLGIGDEFQNLSRWRDDLVQDLVYAEAVLTTVQLCVARAKNSLPLR